MDRPVLPLSEHKAVVGRRLRRLIQLLGLTYVQAAAIMGVSKHVLRNWMAGESYPQPYALYRLARARNVDFNYVFLGDWSALPAKVAQPLEAELAQGLGGAEAEAPTGGEKAEPQTASGAPPSQHRGQRNKNVIRTSRT